METQTIERQTYKFKSNARRAARAAGLDPEAAVIEIHQGIFAVNHPNGDDGLDLPEFLMREPESEEARNARYEAARKERSRALRMPSIDRPKAQSPKKSSTSRAAAGNKSNLLVSMLKDKNGATVEQLVKALGWKPHTLRARISGIAKPKSRGGEGLKVERERKDGVTRYRIAA